MVKVIGVLSLLTAVVLLGFGVFMLVLQTPLTMCVFIASTSLFPLIVAVACLMPRYRSLAIRVIGAIVCLVCIGMFASYYFGDGPQEIGTSRRGRSLLIALGVGGAAMAVKGRWPGDRDNKNDAVPPNDGNSQAGVSNNEDPRLAT